MANKFSSGPSFTQHVPVHPGGTDPSWNNKAIGQPAPIRQTQTFQWINRGNGSGFVGRMGGAPSAGTATIVCTQANVTPGTHSIRVGKFELRPAVDFEVGVSDIAMATNLSAAIATLPGYTAASGGTDTVAVETTTGHGDDHRIEVVEWGAASAFTLTATDRAGYMDRGAPAPGAPDFT